MKSQCHKSDVSHICKTCKFPCEVYFTSSWGVALGFPHYYKPGWLRSKQPSGWEDLGEVKPYQIDEYGKSYTEDDACKACNRVLHMGRENDKLFKFCTSCLIKVDLACYHQRRMCNRCGVEHPPIQNCCYNMKYLAWLSIEMQNVKRVMQVKGSHGESGNTSNQYEDTGQRPKD